mgnify:CR=1 FL=1
MSIQMYKTGNIKTSAANESDSLLINSFTTLKYTPASATNNSCMGANITGFTAGKEYYIEMTVIWSGFVTDTASNFNIRAQGATYDGSSWVWTIGNPMAGSFPNFKTMVLGADSGKQFYRYKFKASYTGYQLGCRTDYSNGKGVITYSDIKVIPADQYVDGSISSGKILSDSIAMDNFIEN